MGPAPGKSAMHAWSYRGLVGPTFIALGCLLLAGCVERPAPTPADAVAQLRTGGQLLSCREPCLAEWQRVQPQAAQLAADARWQDLAVLVLRTGYQDDLSLYYLGRAAEGIGYPGAAASYYRQSMRLSGTSVSCQILSRQCGGAVLPRAAALRGAAIDRELARPRSRRPGSAPQGPELPAAAPAGEGAEPPVEPAVLAPAEIAAPAPRPVSIPGGPAASEYIEPPAAAR